MRRDRVAVTGFRPYATAYLISEAGSAVSMITLPILVFQLTSSALWTAAVGAATAVPYLVLGLFAGVLADRRPRAHLMVGANLASGVVLASIPLAFRFWHLTAAQVVIAALFSQAAFVFYDAANFGFLMSLVGRDRILSANGFLYSAMSVLETIAPAAVGLTLSRVPVAYFVLFDAATFVLSAFLIGWIPAVAVPESTVALPRRGLIPVVVEGLRYFFENRIVGRMTLISALMTSANGGVMSVLVIWVTRTFGMRTDDGRIGVYYAAIAVSGIAAGKVAELAGRVWSVDVAMKALVPASAVLAYVMLIVPVWWLAAIFLGLSSGLGLAGVILAVTVRQQSIPDGLQGRVNTLGRMFAFGLGFSVGAIIAGGLGQAVPIRDALAVVLLMRVIATVVTYRPVRRAAARVQVSVAE